VWPDAGYREALVALITTTPDWTVAAEGDAQRIAFVGCCDMAVS
jgi:hypothetical protein